MVVHRKTYKMQVPQASQPVISLAMLSRNSFLVENRRKLAFGISDSLFVEIFHAFWLFALRSCDVGHKYSPPCLSDANHTRVGSGANVTCSIQQELIENIMFAQLCYAFEGD